LEGVLDQQLVELKYLEFKYYICLLLNQLKKIIYPKGVFVLKYDQNPIDNKFISSIISLFICICYFFYFNCFIIFNWLDFITAISGAATSISNVGPGLGQ
jgi:trk system potassium uptake protein TrkH